MPYFIRLSESSSVSHIIVAFEMVMFIALTLLIIGDVMSGVIFTVTGIPIIGSSGSLEYKVILSEKLPE